MDANKLWGDPGNALAQVKHLWDAWTEYQRQGAGIDKAKQMADLYRYRSQVPMSDADLELVNGLYKNTPLP